MLYVFLVCLNLNEVFQNYHFPKLKGERKWMVMNAFCSFFSFFPVSYLFTWMKFFFSNLKCALHKNHQCYTMNIYDVQHAVYSLFIIFIASIFFFFATFSSIHCFNGMVSGAANEKFSSFFFFLIRKAPINMQFSIWHLKKKLNERP